MRLFVRVEGSTPFGLILNDNLLHEHLVEIAREHLSPKVLFTHPMERLWRN